MGLKPHTRQILYVSAVLCNAFSLGFLYGYPATMIPYLKDKNNDIQANTEIISWIVALPGLFALLLNITIGPLMNSWGRKKTHLLISFCGLIGWVMAALSFSIYSLLLARAFHGFIKGGKVFFEVCTAELSSPNLRGLFLTLEFTVLILSIAVSHSVGLFIHWRQLALFGAAASLLSLLITIMWPETPEWLVFKHRFDEAENTFFKIRQRNPESEDEINKMIVKAKHKQAINIGSKLKILKIITSKPFWSVAALITSKQILIECGGRHYFSAFLIELITNTTGDKNNIFIYTIVLDIISIVASLISCYLVNKFSRRCILINVGSLSVILLLGFCLTLFLYENYLYITSVYIILQVFFVSYYVTVFGLLFTAAGILNGELWPLEFRHIGVVYSSLISSITFTIWMKLVPYLSLYLHVYGMFTLSALIISAVIVHLFVCLPETHNRTLHDIGEYFEQSVPKCDIKDEEKQEFLKENT